MQFGMAGWKRNHAKYAAQPMFTVITTIIQSRLMFDGFAFVTTPSTMRRIK